MDFRFHRLKLAVGGSAGVKVLGLVIHLLAYPIAIAVLGVDRFGVFVVLSSTLTFIQLTSLGIGPGLTMRISAASARKDKAEAARLFSTAFFLLLGICGFVMLAGIGVAQFLPVHQMFGQSYNVDQVEVRESFMVLAIVLALQILLSIGPTTRNGYLEQYKNSISNAVGHVVSIALLVFAVPEWPTIPMMVIAANSSLIVAQFLNTIWLVVLDRPYLFPKTALFRRTTCRVLLGTGVGFLCIRIGAIITVHITSILVGTIGGPIAIAQFAVVLRIVYVFWGITNMFTSPFWPALADAVVSEDVSWAQKSSKRLALGATLYGIAGALVIAFAGDHIVRAWIGPDVRPSSMMFLFMGLYFLLSTWSQVMETIVIGTGRVWIVAYVTIAQGISTVALTVGLLNTLGAYGAAVALCLGALCSHVWVMPLVARRELDRLGKSGSMSKVFS